jgi:hypothetical protein
MAAESAVYNIAHNISEESLYDRDLTAEAVLANTGHAAILGAGIGAAVPTALMTGKAIAEGVLKSTPVEWAMNGAARQVSKFFDPDRSAALYSGAMSKGDLLRDTLKGERFQTAVRELREGGFYKGGKIDLDLATGDLLQVEKGALPSQQRAFERLTYLTEKAGTGMGDILKSADDAVRAAEAKPFVVWGEADSQKLIEKIEKWQRTIQIDEGDAVRLRKTLVEIEQGINASNGELQQMHAIRRGLDKRIGGKNWESLKGEEIELVKDIRRTLNTKISERIEALGEEGIVAKDTVERWARLNRLYGNLKAIEEPLDWAKARAEANVNVGGLRWRDLLATSIGASAFGPIGAIPGLANRALQTEQGLLMRAAIGERLQQLSWAENLTRLTEKGIVDGVRAFVSKVDAAGAASKTLQKLGPAIARASVEAQPRAERRQNQQAWFADVQEQLAAVVADPQGFAHKQAEALQPLAAAAPELADQIVEGQLKAHEYLASVMPKSSAAPLQPLQTKFRAPDYEIQRFRQVVQVVRQPLSILEDLRRGTVTRQQTQAIEALYPRLYERLRIAAEQQINAPDAPKLSYTQRRRLGILFPGVEPTMTPDFIRLVSANLAPEEESKGSGIRSTANLKLSADHATAVDKLSG